MSNSSSQMLADILAKAKSMCKDIKSRKVYGADNKIVSFDISHDEYMHMRYHHGYLISRYHYHMPQNQNYPDSTYEYVSLISTKLGKVGKKLDFVGKVNRSKHHKHQDNNIVRRNGNGEYSLIDGALDDRSFNAEANDFYQKARPFFQ